MDSTCVPEPAGARVSALLVSVRRGGPVRQPCVLPAEGGLLSGIPFSRSLPPCVQQLLSIFNRTVLLPFLM